MNFRVSAEECVSEHGKKACKEIGGNCVTEQDGYYTVSIICIVTGTLLFIFFILPVAKKLEGA